MFSHQINHRILLLFANKLLQAGLQRNFHLLVCLLNWLLNNFSKQIDNYV